MAKDKKNAREDKNMKMVDYEQYLFRDEKAEASNKKEYDNMTGFKKTIEASLVHVHTAIFD